MTFVLTRSMDFNGLNQLYFWSGDGCLLLCSSGGTGKGQKCILY